VAETGHVHQFEIVSRDPAVVFPGCIQGRHIRETGPKGGVLLTVTEGAAPEIRHVPLDVLRWAHLPVDLSGAMSSSPTTAIWWTWRPTAWRSRG
jgi:DNA repair exonuclease SbcCD nuclease subunit